MGVQLLPYDPAWRQAFGEEAVRLRGAFGDLFVDLQHIGSTAVPGLLAKPVIDILAVVPRVEALDLQRYVWEALGYEVMGELAQECAGDMGLYSEGKTDFIRDIERRAAIWRSQ